MGRLVFHNFSIDYATVLPAFFNIDQLGLFMASEGDLLVTRNRIPGPFLEILQGAGLPTKALHCASPQRATANDPFSIFSDDEFWGKVSELAKNLSLRQLDSFIVTSLEERLAHRLTLSLEGNSSLAVKLNNKSSFRHIARGCKIRVPAGFSDIGDTLDALIAGSVLFLTGAKEIVIKQDEGVAGLSSSRLTLERFISTTLSGRAGEFFTEGVRPFASRRYVVEKWYPTISSPSAQCFIESDGTISILSLHEQLFYENRMSYRGCRSEHWIAEDLRLKLRKDAAVLAASFAALGYRGHLSFNGIVCFDGAIRWTEANLRRVISSYPFALCKRLFGDSASQYAYVSSWFRKPQWKGLSPEEFARKIEYLLFAKGKTSGILPLEWGMLTSRGQVAVVAFAKRPDEAEALLSNVDSL